jgi:steroid delta-isomerase-like uncharacterized protein
MSPEENKAIIRRYLDEVWNKGNWQVAEEVIAEDAVFHDIVREGDLPPGREGIRAAMERVSTGMPDFTMDVHEVVAEGDIVVIRWSSTGTHAGEFNGIPPTGRAGTLHAISIVRMKDGRIVEGWQEADTLGLVQQLGLMPKGPMPRPLARLISFGIRLKDRLARRP